MEVAIKNPPGKLFEKKELFIPAKEMLSIFPRFAWLYERKEIEFDETYYDLCRALDAPLLKNLHSYHEKSKIIESLEKIIKGKVKVENGRFYLITQDLGKLEINLVAEGLRKVAMLVYLLSNDSLDENSILIWDEPESNLNPRLIKLVAKTLLEFSEYGVQIFIATHSLFLLKEIEILKNKESNIEYFGLSLTENGVKVSQGKGMANIDDLVVLDEALQQSDRYLNKRNRGKVNENY